MAELSAVALGYTSLEDSLPRNGPLRDTNAFHQASSRDQSCLSFALDFSWEFTNLPHKTRLTSLTSQDPDHCFSNDAPRRVPGLAKAWVSIRIFSSLGSAE